MNIQQTTPYNVTMTGAKGKRPWYDFKLLRKIKQKTLDIFPETTLKESEAQKKQFKKFEEILSRPAENRLLVGATAMLTQPAIDYYNHRVDDETRTVSRNRTIAKIIAGTSVGILVRQLCYQIIQKTTQPEGKRIFSHWFLPNTFKEFSKDISKIKNYRNAVSTLLALCAMSVTNVVLDAPLTLYLTNKFNSKCNVAQNDVSIKKQNLRKGDYE